MPIFIDLSGRKFGSLYVVNRATTSKRKVHWNCICDCGQRCVVRGCSLVSGHTVSCGCVGALRLSEHRLVHGQSNTRTYRIWVGMHGRCRLGSQVRNYSSRGIRVCERWRLFEAFLADMGQAPKGMTLDRHPNNDGNYEPGNCRWASNREQARNKRSNLNLTWQGETRCLQDWATHLHINAATLYARIAVYGWPIDRAFTRQVTKSGDRRPISVNQNRVAA